MTPEPEATAGTEKYLERDVALEHQNDDDQVEAFELNAGSGAPPRRYRWLRLFRRNVASQIFPRLGSGILRCPRE